MELRETMHLVAHPTRGWFLIVATGVVLAANSGCGDEGTGPDTEPPRVVTTTPADGAQEVALTAAITVRFDEAMQSGTVTDTTIVAEVDGSRLAGATELSAAQEVRWTGAAALPAQRLVEVQVAPVADLAGLRSSPFAFSFTTGADPSDRDGDGFSEAAGDCDDEDPAVHPGAVDWLDPDQTDANCDGADGDLSQLIYVSEEGRDDAPGTMVAPMRTPAAALARARAQGTNGVVVALGSYVGALEVPEGVSIAGGYDPGAGWTRAAGARSTLVCTNVALRAEDIARPTWVLNWVLETRPPAVPGTSVTAVLARAADSLRVVDCVLRAAPGAPGADGLAGLAGGTGDVASAGEAACEGGEPPCAACSAPAAGVGGLANGVSGGTGGAAGLASAGGDGELGCGAGGGNPGAGGLVGAAGQRGGDGQAGAPGGDGLPASGPGSLAPTGLWVGQAGGAGQPGAPGAGGGGGGGGGGVTTGDCQWYGGGGGGGGAGGEGGEGGGGGEAGGGSFGAIVIDCSPLFRAIEIEVAGGGPGGDGGLGGGGAPGLPGGAGGGAQGGSGAGGPGGHGGPGGAGGRGGGGAGGHAFGFWVVNGAPLLEAVTYTIGAPGAGGQPGGARGESGEVGP